MDKDKTDWAFQILPVLPALAIVGISIIAIRVGQNFGVLVGILTGAGIILSTFAIRARIIRAASRCSNCMRFWAAELIRSEVIQRARGLLGAEKTRDHYQCKYCGHTWTKLKIDRRTPAKGGPRRL